MIKSAFKIAWRNLIRSKSYSLINILGLAIGIAVAILVTIFIIDELSYDQFHSKGDRIYRLSFSEQRQDTEFRYAKVPFPAREVLMSDIPEIEDVTRLYNNVRVSEAAMIHIGEEIYAESDLWFAEPSFFHFFDFEMIAGNPSTALNDNNSVVLTESTARKYFGDEDPIGKKIGYYQSTIVEVTGVVKDPPKNSHIQFDLLLPLKFLRTNWTTNYGYDFEVDWKWSGSYSYVLLKEGTSIQDVLPKLGAVVDLHFREIAPGYELIPLALKDIYLRSTFRGEMNSGSEMKITELYTFGLIAAVILLVACINFMNLSTARSTQRAREVGIRKVMGARRYQLISQFYGEAMLIALIAFFHALLLINILLPAFNYYTGKSFSFLEEIGNFGVLGLSLGLTVLVGLFSGSYPALFLSSFIPIKTLKNDLKIGGNLPIRKMLVLVQFVITIVFISAVVVIYSQLQFIRDKELGFDKEQTMIIQNRTLNSPEFILLKDELLKNPDVSEVYHGHIPGKPAWGNSVIPEGYTDDEAVSVAIMYVGYDFTGFFNINILEGRSFSQSLDVDTVNARSSFMINRKLADQIGWGVDQAIGKEIKWIGGNDNRQLIKGRIVAVVDDFHYNSLYNNINPLVLRLSDWGEVAIKYNYHKTAELVPAIEKTWEELFPSQKFNHSFLDEDLQRQYTKEENLASLINYFTGLAIFISCLGLFGLASFTVEQRRKEFAIRKALGATVAQISALISTDFGKLIVMAAVFAIPIGWWVLQDWLDGFAYSISLQAWHFALAILTGLVISILTISVQLNNAARTNPAESLRNE